MVKMAIVLFIWKMNLHLLIDSVLIVNLTFCLLFLIVSIKLIDMPSSRKFMCFGKEVHSFRVCSCFYDITVFALGKVETINDFWNLYEKHGVDLSENLFWNYYSDCYLTCCRRHIDWLVVVNYKNVFSRSSNECIECPRLFELSCLNFAKDLSDFCINCTSNLCDVLEKSLYHVKASEDQYSSSSSNTRKKHRKNC